MVRKIKDDEEQGPHNQEAKAINRHFFRTGCLIPTLWNQALTAFWRIRRIATEEVGGG